MASKKRNEKQISLLLYSTWTHTVVPLENFHQIFMGRQKYQAKVINQACKILTQSSILSKVLFFCLPNEYLIPWVDVFCHFFCCQLHLLALEGWPPCPQYQVTFPLSHPIFSCFWEGGWFLQTISSVYSAFSSSCIWSFLNVQCPLDRDLTSPKLGCWNRQQHVGNVLCTVLVMKENFSFNSKTFSCSEPVLRHALSFLLVQPPRTPILGAHGNTQSLSEGEFCPPLPQRDDEKVTPVSTPLLICPQQSELSHLWECEVLSRFPLLLIALDSLRRVEGSLSSDSLRSTN